jgi:hypothetical protein
MPFLRRSSFEVSRTFVFFFVVVGCDWRPRRILRDWSMHVALLLRQFDQAGGYGPPHEFGPILDIGLAEEHRKELIDPSRGQVNLSGNLFGRPALADVFEDFGLVRG